MIKHAYGGTETRSPGQIGDLGIVVEKPDFDPKKAKEESLKKVSLLVASYRRHF